ncbi:MAG: proteasome subunit beta [Thaumarchaeota archaeon]|nr:proteasome subunit beta [Nitrososphaerota archaeon]MCL5318986.1 proteasome subunit beta [Nitrososphaerota archaeon]
MSYMPGATAVGIAFKGGVVVAAEKRVAYGTYVVSKTGRKVFKISDKVGAACAGLIGDMQVLMREISAYVKIRELEMRRDLPPNSVAKLLSVIMFERRFAPFITQIVIGGVDDKPLVYVLDPLGSIIPDKYASVGSGAEMAIGVIENEFTDNMSEDAAKNLAVKSIKSSIQRDAASGDGIDLMIITQSGIREETISF